jgi:4-hydroxybenzoate polyprenyltransferase
MLKLFSAFKSPKLLQLFNHNFGLFAFIYTWLSFSHGTEGVEFLPSALVLFSSFFFIGVYGYVLNDIFDVQADESVGKYNIVSHWNKYQKWGVLVFSASAGVSVLAAHNIKTLPFLIAQLIVLFVYSVPVIRLKERGLSGILADAFYAYVNPAIIMLIVLKAYAEIDLFIYVFIFLFYLCIGLKNIFQHQADDLSNDLKAGIKTFASQYPQWASKAPYLFILFSWIVWTSFSIYYTPHIRDVLFFPLLYIPIFTILLKGVFSLIFKRKEWISQSPEMDVIFYGFIFLWISLIRQFNFYYWPIFLFLFLPVIHSKIRLWVIQIYRLLYWYVISFSVNYFLYYSFKLFGLDLKERAKKKKIMDKLSVNSKKQISREEIVDKWMELI